METEEQALGLDRMGCDLLQGFRFYRPMELDAHAAEMARLRRGSVPEPVLYAAA